MTEVIQSERRPTKFNGGAAIHGSLSEDRPRTMDLSEAQHHFAVSVEMVHDPNNLFPIGRLFTWVEFKRTLESGSWPEGMLIDHFEKSAIVRLKVCKRAAPKSLAYFLKEVLRTPIQGRSLPAWMTYWRKWPQAKTITIDRNGLTWIWDSQPSKNRGNGCWEPNENCRWSYCLGQTTKPRHWTRATYPRPVGI